MSAQGTPAIAALRRAGVRFEVLSYEAPERHGRDRADRPSYGLDASEALGVEPARMFKTLIASTDSRLVAALVPVDRELDLKRLAAAADARNAILSAPLAAERTTGYVVGGISPLGQKRRLTTVVDVSALTFPLVLVSAGRRGVDVELAPTDLIRLTTANTAPVARRHG